MTPGAITEAWTAFAGKGKGWAEVAGARIVGRAAFEAAEAVARAADAAEQAALREPARAAAEWRADPDAAVAARKAAAPPEVRIVLDGKLGNDGDGLSIDGGELFSVLFSAI
jgi:hypothetical protein